MEFHDLHSARDILERATEKREELGAKLDAWEDAHPNWEDDDDLFDERERMYDEYDAFCNLADVADDYIYECNKLIEYEESLELALVEVGWENE